MTTTCYICLAPGGDMIRSPCTCRTHVHATCFSTMLRETGSSRCTICRKDCYLWIVRNLFDMEIQRAKRRSERQPHPQIPPTTEPTTSSSCVCYICLDAGGDMIKSPCTCRSHVHTGCFSAMLRGTGASKCTICRADCYDWIVRRMMERARRRATRQSSHS